MKLATFEIPTAAGPLRRIGAAVDGRLIDFAAGYAAYLEKTDPGCDAQRLAAMLFSSDMVAFLGTGDLGRRAAEQAIEAASRHADAFGARTSYAATGSTFACAGTSPARDSRLSDVRRPHADRREGARASVDSARVVRGACVLQRRSRYGVRSRRRDRMAEVPVKSSTSSWSWRSSSAGAARTSTRRTRSDTLRATQSGTTGALAISR